MGRTLARRGEIVEGHNHAHDFSPIALFLFVGLASLAFGIVFGGYLWTRGYETGLPTPTGSIILCLLALVVGFQLCLQAIVFDIQATPR